jgi:immune inhibitor A
MIIKSCSCDQRSIDSYELGPTACVASPEVMKNIREQIAATNVLSTADARVATLAGMLNIPSVERTGFNDGVIYDPGAGPAVVMAATTAKSPVATLSLKKSSSKSTLNCLVLLVDFSDNVGTKPSTHFENLLFDATNANSMRSFYKDLSFGKLDVTGSVTDWIRAKHPYSYYTAGASGTGSAYPQNVPGLLNEVLHTYCLKNSLAPFDANGDGYVDGLFLVHAGSGAETESNPTRRANMIWSHKWVLPTPFMNNGVQAYAYFTAPEDGRLGVFSHEFGHFIGLPDLYDTSYRSEGIGNWCLMAGGSWNGAGNTPARMSAWCLSTLGWTSPTNLKKSGTVTLQAHEVDKTASYRLWSGGKASKEYFLIENRQKKGRDAGLPGSGLALWHIDETQAGNTNPLAYRVALVQADGKRDLEFARNRGDAGDLFPGSKKVVQVDDTGVAHPHTRKNDGTSSGVALSNIKDAAGVVTADVKV